MFLSRGNLGEKITNFHEATCGILENISKPPLRTILIRANSSLNYFYEKLFSNNF